MAIVAACLLATAGAASGAGGGVPDGSFGAGGVARTAFPGFEAARASTLLVNPDGTLLAAGSANDREPPFFDPRFAIARYDRDGRPDSSFGEAGRATAVLGEFSDVRALAVQSDGKIVAAGNAGDHQTFVLTTTAFGLARFERNGSLDPSFGTQGTVSTQFPGTVFPFGYTALADVALDGNGIVAVGTWVKGGTALEPARIAVARYLADGSLDPEFGEGGTVTTARAVSVGAPELVAPHASGRSVAIIDDAIEVAAVSESEDIPRLQEVMLVRYRRDGSLDLTFGAGGIRHVVVSTSTGLAQVQILADDTIVALSQRSIGFGNRDSAWLIVRLDADGEPLGAFGDDGYAIVNPSGGPDEPSSAALDDDGRLVVVGCAGCRNDGGMALAVAARLLPDGTLDASFGDGGVVVVRLAAAGAFESVSPQAPGRLLVAGSAALGGAEAFGIAALRAAGAQPSIRRRFAPISPPGRRIPIVPR
jgi:uncharacterized delta-60 repeat protein